VVALSKERRGLGRSSVGKLAGSVSHHEWEVEELRRDRKFAIAYATVAIESLNEPEERPAGLLMLRAVAEAYGGLGAVAAQAGISRESLYRTLSPKGNPTLKTLIAILDTMGLRLSVVPASAKKAAARKKPARKARKTGAKAAKKAVARAA
jgi:probable addiction module antidote protein